MATQTGRGYEQTFRMFFEHFIIDARLKIKAIGIRKMDQFAEVFIADIIFDQNNEMVIFVLRIFDICIFSQVGLDAQDGLDASLFRLLEKLNGAKDIAMVRNS